MLLITAAVLSGAVVGFVFGWYNGWRIGVNETEERWSEAVARADDARAKAVFHGQHTRH